MAVIADYSIKRASNAGPASSNSWFPQPSNPTPVGPTLLTEPALIMIGASLTSQNHMSSQSPTRAFKLSVGPWNWALAKDKRAKVRVIASGTASNINVDGFNAAVYGTTSNDGTNGYAIQIPKALSAVPAGQDTVAHIEFSRNDIEGGQSAATMIATMQTSLATLFADGRVKFVMIPTVAMKNTSLGGGWASGGAYRTIVNTLNAWIDSYVLTESRARVIDLRTLITDPSSGADQNPYSWVYRDGTHWTPYAAKRMGETVFLPVLQGITNPISYPARPGDSLLAAFSTSAVAGSKSGLTGNVATGWSATSTDAGATVVADVVTGIGAEPYQRFTVSSATAVSTNGGEVRFAGSMTVANGARVRLRLKLVVKGTAIPHIFTAGIGGTATTSNQGNTTQARAFSMMPQTTATSSTILFVAGTAWNTMRTQTIDGTSDNTYWLETDNYILGTGGAIDVYVGMIFGPAANSGDTLDFYIGEMHTVPWDLS